MLTAGGGVYRASRERLYRERSSASLSRAALRYDPLRGRQRLGAWTGVCSIGPRELKGLKA